ncbi:MAG: hypothetical protein KDA21_05700, partial [Phycisphaerales bacterium]|nr:hypothetical protein [Phycisphaerales bacterium]
VDKAETLYRGVLSATESDPRKLILTQAARQGVVSALLSRGGDKDFAEAEALLDQIIASAEEAGGLEDQATIARRLKAELPRLRHPIPAVSMDALPRSARDLPMEEVDDFSQMLPPTESAGDEDPAATTPEAGEAGDDAADSASEDATGGDDGTSDGGDGDGEG